MSIFHMLKVEIQEGLYPELNNPPIKSAFLEEDYFTIEGPRHSNDHFTLHCTGSRNWHIVNRKELSYIPAYACLFRLNNTHIGFLQMYACHRTYSDKCTFVDVYNRDGEYCYELTPHPFETTTKIDQTLYFSNLAMTTDSMWFIQYGSTNSSGNGSVKDNLTPESFLQQHCINTGKIISRKLLCSTHAPHLCLPHTQKWITNYGYQSRIFIQWKNDIPYVRFTSHVPYVKPIRRIFNISLANVIMHEID